MAETNSAGSLIDLKDAELVNLNGCNRSFGTYCYFLKPTSSISSYLPSLFDYKSSDFKSPNYSSNFRWWAVPPDDYRNWVDKLAPKFKNIWKKTGIFEAIMASKHQIRQEPITLATFCQFWCGETNTFAFPWGEATITLEDVMILGNFPVLGEPLNVVDELSEAALSNMEAIMKQEMRYLKNKLKKGINQFSWMHHYLESGKGDEVEHIAFLTYWLSKFVLISSRRGITENLFKVAVRLARGTKVALGYPVLASIYTFLSVMNQYIRSGSTSTLCCMTWAPMNIFQVWVWERFPSLKPKVKSLTSVDMPRVARWTMQGPIYDNLAVTKIIESRDEFIWRPYVMDLENWLMPSFYVDDNGTWYESNESLDEGLRSYARCLSVCKLVGLNCVKQYHPHRVAMQFGLNQDIPMFIHPTNEDVSENIDMNSSNLWFYVAPRLCKSYVTSQYYAWWKRIEVDSVVTTRNGKKTRKRIRKRKGNMLDSNIRKKFLSRSDATLTVKGDLGSKPSVSDANENKESGHLDGNEKENIEDLSIVGESMIVNQNHLDLNINKEIDISTVEKELKVDHMKINQLKDLDPKPNELDANENKENCHQDANENKENGRQDLPMEESIIEQTNHLSNEEMDISAINKVLEVDYREINRIRDLHPKPNVLDANNILDGNEKKNIKVHQDLSMIGQSVNESKNDLELDINEEMDNSTFWKGLEEDYRKINQLKEEIKIIEEKIKFIESQS